MTEHTLNNTEWKENVILVDADYIDRVAFDLIVNFERMIGRRIPKADLAQWIVCVALDGGLRQGDNETQVVLLHAKDKTGLDNFTPGDFTKDLDGKAFKDEVGEFLVSCVPVEDLVTMEDLFVDAMQVVCNSGDVKRVMVIPDAEHIYNNVREGLRHTDNNKTVTVFSMEPMPGGKFQQEILGYSLMAAMGIRADEIK